MGFLLRIVGFGLLILGIYLVGENIFFTTNVYPYWWRGISADISVLALTSGVLLLVFAPGSMKDLGWTAVAETDIPSKSFVIPTPTPAFIAGLVPIKCKFQLFGVAIVVSVHNLELVNSSVGSFV